MTLNQLEKGDIARIVRIDGDVGLRRKLLNLEVSLNSEVRFLRRAPLGNPLAFLIGDNMVAIRKNIAQKIQIELLPNIQSNH